MQNDTHRTGCGCVTCGPARPNPDFNQLEPEELRVATLEKALRDVKFELLLHDTDAMGRSRRWVWELQKVIDAALEGK